MSALIRPGLFLIAARARNGVVGIDNTLPWRLPEDLRYFKQTTLGHPVLMGRKTFESIGRPLPGRRNIVLSRDPDWQAAGVEAVRSLPAALMLLADIAPIFVIGGAELYRQALPYAERLYLTEIDVDFAGDAHFPDIDHKQWQETQRDSHHQAQAGWDYHFVVYQHLP